MILHFCYYSLANQLQHTYKWTHPNHPDNSWLDIEQTFCKNIQISYNPFLSQSFRLHPCFQAITIALVLIAWWKFHKEKSIVLTNFTPILNNPNFLGKPPPPKILNFHTWAEKGIINLKHVFRNNTPVLSTWSRSMALGATNFWKIS